MHRACDALTSETAGLSRIQERQKRLEDKLESEVGEAIDPELVQPSHLEAVEEATDPDTADMEV